MPVAGTTAQQLGEEVVDEDMQRAIAASLVDDVQPRIDPGERLFMVCGVGHMHRSCRCSRWF